MYMENGQEEEGIIWCSPLRPSLLSHPCRVRPPNVAMPERMLRKIRENLLFEKRVHPVHDAERRIYVRPILPSEEMFQTTREARERV